MSDDRTKADRAWETQQEATAAASSTLRLTQRKRPTKQMIENYLAVLDQAGDAAEAAAAEITGYKTYADLLEALDTRRKQS